MNSEIGFFEKSAPTVNEMKNEEILTIQQREIETLKQKIISLHLKELKILSDQVFPGQIEKVKIPNDSEIFDEDMLLSSKPHQTNSIQWRICHNELSTKIHLNESESGFVDLNFKEEYFDNDNDDLLKITCKKIKVFVHLSEEVDFKNLEITLSCSDGINFFHKVNLMFIRFNFKYKLSKNHQR